MTFGFGPYELDTDSRRFTRDGIEIHLTPKAYDLLLVLVRERPRALSKAELHRRVWSDTHVSEATLTALVGELREALGETGRRDGLIRTVPRFGFRFATWTEAAGAPNRGTAGASLPARVSWRLYVAYASLAVAIFAVTSLGLTSARPEPLGSGESVGVLVADFVNATGDEVWNLSLKQAVSIGLCQSPTLRIVSPSNERSVLVQMKRDPDAGVTPALALEACERAGADVAVTGSIAAAGRSYLLGLDAVSCADGRVLARSQATAGSATAVVSRFGAMTSELRARLGESSTSIRRLNPLECSQPAEGRAPSTACRVSRFPRPPAG